MDVVNTAESGDFGRTPIEALPESIEYSEVPATEQQA